MHQIYLTNARVFKSDSGNLQPSTFLQLASQWWCVRRSDHSPNEPQIRLWTSRRVPWTSTIKTRHCAQTCSSPCRHSTAKLIANKLYTLPIWAHFVCSKANSKMSYLFVVFVFELRIFTWTSQISNHPSLMCGCDDWPTSHSIPSCLSTERDSPFSRVEFHYGFHLSPIKRRNRMRWNRCNSLNSTTHTQTVAYNVSKEDGRFNSIEPEWPHWRSSIK